jgi:hypothetical protein
VVAPAAFHTDTKNTVILIIHCVITSETARSLLGAPFSGALSILEEEEDEEDLDIREYVDQVEPRFIRFSEEKAMEASDTVNVAVVNQGE